MTAGRIGFIERALAEANRGLRRGRVPRQGNLVELAVVLLYGACLAVLVTTSVWLRS